MLVHRCGRGDQVGEYEPTNEDEHASVAAEALARCAVAAGRRIARCYAHLMLRPIADLPGGVLGFEATGEIQASDYRDVLMPAVREVWERGDEVRIVLVFERWDGMSSGAAWEDLKVGMKNLTKWKRIALATDLDWMITVASLFGWMTPGDLKRFPVAEREQAIAWAAGDG